MGVGGVWLEVGEEDMEYKSWNEVVKDNVKQSRIVRRGGRFSNMIKTLEQGAKQSNKIISYFTKSGEGMEDGQ